MERENEMFQFDCMITNSDEEYDSGIWEFFTKLIFLESDVGLLLIQDLKWKENYEKILQYLSDFSLSILMRRGMPDDSFVKQLIDPNAKEVDTEMVLSEANNTVPSLLLRAETDAREVIAWYTKMSKVPRFSELFDKKKFYGFLKVGSIFEHRFIKLATNK